VASFLDSVIGTRAGSFSFSETGDGPTRVVLHSLLTDRRAFEGVSASIGGRVLAIDLPGFGLTDPAQPQIDDYAHRVAAFIEAMDLDPDGLTLIGNGLGAFVALGTAIHHGETFDRLILVGCGARFPEHAKTAFTTMIAAVEAGGLGSVVPIALRRIFTDDYLAANPEIAEERASVLRGIDPTAFVNACHALRSVDYTGLATIVKNPTLLVVGEDDQATPPELAEELSRLIPDSTLVRLPGLAHAPHLQNPRAFSEATEQFLEKR
jgi:3-oxoadipate enol-lactonase